MQFKEGQSQGLMTKASNSPNSSAKRQDLAPLQSAAIPARFHALLSALPESEHRKFYDFALSPAMEGIVFAELRDFGGFAEHIKPWSQNGLDHFKSEHGAQTNKIAASQVLKGIARATITKLATTYLLTGRSARKSELMFVPTGSAPWIEMYFDPRLDLESLQFAPDVGPSELFELAIILEEIGTALQKGLGRRLVPPAVFYSSIAMALAHPFMELYRSGADPNETALLLQRFMAGFGKRVGGGLVWRQRQNNSRVEVAPRRKSCCLKYTLNGGSSQCFSCSRRAETLYFERHMPEHHEDF
ncbi:hypothetical protein E1162_16710 [Rhodobacteraceae bacterium RKSG542]|uniref:hypothetical protein n=1 Tax=Pseudovibrio flavus TaxID=2529854 RepID=UPI0012BD4C19|nr:hypothetical protein [Pseudovibrio flavus]MTI18886.1 hypothetical protein [Pseudovibrio flavus]